jgi:hypothetical protein
MSNEYRVTLQTPRWLGQEGDVCIHTRHLNLPRLAVGQLQKDEVIHVCIPQESFARNPEAYARFATRLTVCAQDPAPAALLAMLDPLRQLNAQYELDLRSPTDVTMAMMASSLGVPVRLAWRNSWDASLLGELLDYMLYSPTLSVPIEPFYSLAEAVAGAEEKSLPHLFGEVLGRDFFVDEAGRLTLSPRWAQAGEFFGTLGQSLGELAESELWKRLAARGEQVFAAQTPCAFCEHHPCCEAFWMAQAVNSAACEAWKDVLDRLANAYRQHAACMVDDAEHPADHLL